MAELTAVLHRGVRAMFSAIVGEGDRAVTSRPLAGPSARPSFGLSDWVSPHEPDAWAAWQAHVDAGRIGVKLDTRAAEAAADEWERIVCGRGAGWSGTAAGRAGSGRAASGRAGSAFHLDVASGSSTSNRLASGSTPVAGGTGVAATVERN